MSIFIILIVIIGLSLLILAHEAGHFLAAKMFGMKVDEFGFGFPPEMFGIPMGKLPPRILGVQRGEVLYSINWIPFGGFVRPAGEADGLAKASEPSLEEKKRILKYQPAWKRSVVILAGLFVNFILGWLLISTVLMIGAPNRVVISEIEPGSPAVQAGFMPGDILKDYTDVNTLINFIDAHEGQQIQLDVIRGGKDLSIAVTPRANVSPNEGPVGIGLEQGGTPKESPLLSLRDGFIATGYYTWLTLQGVGQIIVQGLTHASIPAGVVGPVGIVGVASETAQIGLQYLIQILGIISINLMVVNSIPIPALDGGQFLMIIIGKIKGSPVSDKVMAYANGIAFLLLLVFFIFVTIRDVQTYIL
jgi:regulator of sigma E protease